MSDELETISKALHAQTQRADAMAEKFHERGRRITELESLNADLSRHVKDQDGELLRLYWLLRDIHKRSEVQP